MTNNINISPFNNKLPSQFADRLGVYYSQQVTSKHKKDNGQYFTPTEIVRLMASFSNYTNKSIRILDPGCGTGILTCALIEHLVEIQNDIKLIDLVAYEIDLDLNYFTHKVFTYLIKWPSSPKFITS